MGATVNYISEKTGGEALMFPNESEQFPWTMTGRFEDGTLARISSKEEWDKACVEHSGLVHERNEYPSLTGESVVFTRPLSWLAAHMIDLRAQGRRVLAEVDDFYLAKEGFNIFTKREGMNLKKEGSSWGASLDEHARSICVGDGLIVSTEHLRDQYWAGLRRMFPKQHLPEMFVCRNHVDERFAPKELTPPREDGRLRIGYMGSDSHYWDVELIYPALKYAYDLGHEIVFIGIDPRYSMIKPSEYEIKTRQHWWEIEFTQIPWSDTFRGFAMPLDIGFAPLVVNASSLGKSDIKGMEYALSGAACIAHNCLVYNRTYIHGETALLAGSPSEYVAQLKALIHTKSLRKRLVDNMNQYIREERLLENNKQEWLEAVYG